MAGFKPCWTELQQKHFGVKNLGWTSPGGRFRIYMEKAPKFDDKGMLDLDGVKLRDNPIYGAFFRAMNASTHPLPATQVYSALEKGVVDAAAWATIGLKGLKWDKFLRHAVEPEFYHTDIGWFINLKTWNGLDSGLRKLVQDMVIANEKAVREILARGIEEGTGNARQGRHEVPHRAGRRGLFEAGRRFGLCPHDGPAEEGEASDRPRRQAARALAAAIGRPRSGLGVPRYGASRLLGMRRIPSG